MHADRVFSLCYMFPNLLSLSLMMRYDPPAHVRINTGYALFLLCMMTVPGTFEQQPVYPCTLTPCLFDERHIIIIDKVNGPGP
jgi:hypothetical protein